MAIVELIVHPQLAGLAPDHPAAEAALGELLADLRDVPTLTATQHGHPAPGQKGVASDLVIALGTSGAVGGLVRVVHLWLQRDQRRSLKITRNVDGGQHIVKIEGDNISTEIISQALRSIADSNLDSSEQVDPS